MERALSQEEIDAAFQKATSGQAVAEKKIAAYDFRHLDRIAKEQLRLIHLIYENFARSLAPSLSAYLRSYVIANLVSIEQMSFLEFCRSLSDTAHLATLAVQPMGRAAILELSPSISFSVLDILLGGNGSQTNADRHLTELEQMLLERMYGLIVTDLRTSWQPVAPVEFAFDGFVTDPHLLHSWGPNENVVTVSIDLRIGKTAGLLNLAMHSSLLRPLRKIFQQKWNQYRVGADMHDQEQRLRQLMQCSLDLEAVLVSGSVRFEDALKLNTGDVLVLDARIDAEVDLRVNGMCKYRGKLVETTGRKALLLTSRPE